MGNGGASPGHSVPVMSFLSRILGTRVQPGKLLSPGVQLPVSARADLQSLVWKDIYGEDAGDIVTRETAMMCAPVKKARAVIIGHLSDLPLEIGGFVDGEFIPDAEQPEWLNATTDVRQTDWHRKALTLDALLFDGWSLWVLDRDDTGTITDAQHIAQHRWKFDEASPTGIAVEGEGLLSWFHVTNANDVLLFRGPDSGLLVEAADSIRGWRYMSRAWVGRVRNPLPAIVISEVEPGTVSNEEAKNVVTSWAMARTSELGAVGFLSSKFKMDVLGQVDSELFDKGRNASRIDIANQTNLPVSYLDGSTATASLTYTTQEGTRAQIIDDLEYWLGPIEARLSMPDVTGDPEKVIRFNRSNLTAVPNDTHGAERRDDPAPTPEVTA